MAEMSKARFKISYDGEALREGRMEVRDLAPALLAVGSLFDAANRALNGQDGPKVAVNVTATGTGSFEIALEVVQSLYEQAKSFLAGEDVTAAVNLVTLVVGGSGASGSLIWLVRKLKGRKPEKVERLTADTVRVTLTVEGPPEVIEVPMQTLRLYQDVAVRKSLEGMVHDPLKKEGIDTFKASDGEANPPVVIKEGEAESFAAPEIEGSVVIDETRNMALSIVSLAFKEDRKWRFFDGNSQLSATISDEDFLRKVDNNEPFTKGDVLRCEVRVIQRQTTSGLKSEYTVLKVLEHIPPMRQMPLPFDEPDKGAADADEEKPTKGDD